MKIVWLYVDVEMKLCALFWRQHSKCSPANSAMNVCPCLWLVSHETKMSDSSCHRYTHTRPVQSETSVVMKQQSMLTCMPVPRQCRCRCRRHAICITVLFHSASVSACHSTFSDSDRIYSLCVRSSRAAEQPILYHFTRNIALVRSKWVYAIP